MAIPIVNSVKFLGQNKGQHFRFGTHVEEGVGTEGLERSVLFTSLFFYFLCFFRFFLFIYSNYVIFDTYTRENKETERQEFKFSIPALLFNMGPEAIKLPFILAKKLNGV